MQTGVGYSDIPNSEAAGREAVKQAFSMAKRTDPCDAAFLFCTARHDQAILGEAVRKAVGEAVPIYGGGAAGVITNDFYGYAGDQVGVACLWLDGVTLEVQTDNGLLTGEEGAGFRLGENLLKAGMTADSSPLLFYDAVSSENGDGVRLMMATDILRGMEKAMGFLPAILGAGLMGDHVGTQTDQFVGKELKGRTAMALSFDESIHVDSVIMHGCVPASEYYAVTKAEGPVILEINGEPALDFMNRLLDFSIEPERFPFFLLFGVNHGTHFGVYQEDEYASRLCLGIDKERKGIVMFEPDMVEGTAFQLMFRSHSLAYMKPKIELLFHRLNGRKPVFALYIDCAGRCAGYSGTDLEDAAVLQEMVGDRVPLLGIYSGVEIAPLQGRPRVLDWSGVLCLFSQEEAGASVLPDVSCEPEEEMGTIQNSEELLDQMRSLCEQNAAKTLTLDIQSIALRHELELRRRGFRLLSDLATSLRMTDDYHQIFLYTANRLNAALNMQKTVVLLTDGQGGFSPSVLQGFSQKEQVSLQQKKWDMGAHGPDRDPVIVTPDNATGMLLEMQREYALPFFIASPIFLQNEAVAFLLTGRMMEQEPFFTKLGEGDLETVHAITELLGSVLIRLRLHDVIHRAETDGLTGLWNRTTFQDMVVSYLEEKEENCGTFMMIDLDHFKSVNDTYGHMAGDKLLQTCAASIRGVLRDTDILGRLGGDEFAVFCKGIGDGAAAERKAEQISQICRSIFPGDGTKPLSLSIGISIFPRHGETFQDLYLNADLALYRAKEQGRNRYVLA